MYRFSNPTYNTICQIPETKEESALVAELLPTAKEKEQNRQRELYIYYGGMIVAIIAFSLIYPYVLLATP